MSHTSDTRADGTAPDKRALRNQYKESKPAMGVFMIKNSVNGRLYLGASTNVEAAMNRHRFELQMKTHRNTKLLQDWLAHGAEQFHFALLDGLAYRDTPGADYAAELAALLEMWREELGTCGEQGYNQAGQPADRPQATHP